MIIDEREIATLKGRLNHLERRARLQFVGWAVFSLMLLVLSIGTTRSGAQPTILRARAFELVDASGRPMAYLMTTSAGDPSLSLLDQSGRDRVVLSTLRGQPRLSFRDSSGNSRIYLFTSETTAPVGNTGLILSDSADRNRVQLTIQQDGSPLFVLKDSRGLPRVFLAMSQNSGPGLLIVDENGRRLFRAP